MQEEENIELSNIKSPRSVHWMAHCHANWQRGPEGLQRVSAPCWNRTHHAWLTATVQLASTNKQWVFIAEKKTAHCNLNPFFCNLDPFLVQPELSLLDCSGLISRVDESRPLTWMKLSAAPLPFLRGDSNLIRRPFLRQVVDLDLLLCSARLHRIWFGTTGYARYMWFCSYVICLLRDQWLIKRLSEAIGTALVGNNFSPIPSKISFHMKTKNAHCCLQFAKHKTFQVSTLELSKYCKSGSMFSSSEPVAASSDCSRLVNALCLCSPVLPAQTVQESGPGPKSLAIDWTFNYLLEQRLKRLPNDRQGLKLGHLNSAAWSTSC